MIELRNVEKTYDLAGGKVYVLRRINLTIGAATSSRSWARRAPGSRRSSTSSGCTTGPGRASIDFLGQPLHKLGRKQRLELQKKNIGFVFQSYHLLDDLTVYENLEIPLSYRDVKKSERQAIVADVLDRFQIVGKKDLYPAQLSGGQQQLVAVARAVVASPKIILADEPTGNLHSSQGREIMELFRKLNDEGTTIVQVTHSEQNASYGRRIVKMSDGWIVD